ncbi:DUF397 domain-containing protein [Kitasatospora fiedleri]|uniref:DUF397 domain-containing protein n=1 Tax=Kitasatospora fiedleri TaxID=2991545 RepID=UPI00249C5C61|nr:DUF397 domain-containing protein [Kitasatospora fiedleri]
MSTAFRPSLTEWRKSSYSDPQGQGNCVEIAEAYAASHGVIAIRDSKNPTGEPLLVSVDAWHAFTAAVSAGELGSI